MAKRRMRSKTLIEMLKERYGERLHPSEISQIINGKAEDTNKTRRVIKEIEIIFSEN